MNPISTIRARTATRFLRSRVECSVAILGLAAVLTPAQSADSARVGAYDFSYLMSGDTRARPVQVFDDGRSTYFQFRAGEPVPAIFAARNGVPALVVPTQEGPYVRVPDLHGRFVLQVGRAQAHVVHGEGTRADQPQVNVVTPDGMTSRYAGPATLPAGGRLVASLAPVSWSPAEAQAVDRNSYATPLRGDRVYWPTRSEQLEHSVYFQRGGYVLSREALQRISRVASQPAARYVVIGRDDDTYKEGLENARAVAMRDALVKAGVPIDRVTLRTGVMKGKPNAKSWESTILVETQQEAPGMRAAPAEDQAVASNVEALIRARVIDPSQAQALMQRHRTGASPAAAPVVEVPEGGFTMSPADKTVAGAVRRWAQALGYQLVWDASAEADAAIAGQASLPARNITEAMDILARGLKDKGYDIEVTIYANRVIRFAPPAPTAPAVPAADPATGRSRVTAAVGAGPAVPPAFVQWQMVPTDRTVAGTLSRWASGAKWSLIWNAKDQVPITGAATVTQPDFKSAAEYVMQQVASAGYRLRVTTQGDATLVVSSN